MNSGLFTIEAASYLSRAPSFEVSALAPGLWTVAGGSYRTVFAEGEEGVVALNTFGTPAAARGYRREIEQTVPGKPITALVVTIDHLDHTGYGADLAPDADVIGHELTARVIAGRKAVGQLPITRIVTGTGESLDLQGVRMELHYPGPTQGSGNLAIRFPDHSVLFMVSPQANACHGLFPDFHLEQYPTSLRRVLELEWDTFVPGRYGVMTRADVERSLAYLEAFQTAAQQAFAAGVQIWLIDEMRTFCADLLRADWGDLDGFDKHIGPGAIRLVHHYLMGGWGIEDTQRPDLIREEGVAA